MAGTAHGHLWTIVPDLLARLRSKTIVDAPWSLTIDTPEGGDGPSGVVRLAGEYGGPPSADLFVFVHGLGGDAERHYMLAAAEAVRARGFASLRISMRGAGNSDPDFYHAGLGSDLAAVLGDPKLATHPRVFVIGFSLGGHVTAHLALREQVDPRLTAVVAICSPLDLGRNVDLLDRPSGWLYRRFVLDSLQAGYARVHQTERHFRTIREWDTATIVPRYGFDDVEQYYASKSAGPRLREAKVPFLFVATEGDPMVPSETLEPYLRRAGSVVDTRWLRRGGHIGFPADTDLGLPGERGIYNQLLTWCERL